MVFSVITGLSQSIHDTTHVAQTHNTRVKSNGFGLMAHKYYPLADRLGCRSFECQGDSPFDSLYLWFHRFYGFATFSDNYCDESGGGAYNGAGSTMT